LNGTSPQWVTEWNAQQLTRLPVAVSVEMKSHDPKGNSINRLMVAPIAAEAIDPRFTGAANPFGPRAVGR
jgi:hypothetical protein